MDRDIDLLGYLPQYVQEYAEIDGIMTGENPEFQLLLDEKDASLDRMFIATSDLKGIERYEQMLHISALETDTLEDRRFRIMRKYTNDTLYTLRGLQKRLEQLCGADQFRITLSPSSYYIRVQISLASRKQEAEVEKLLHDVIPCNLTWVYEVLYNRYGAFLEIRYETMENYTWKQLREEDIFQRDYTTHSMLHRYTHGDFTPYTHKQLMFGEFL